MNVQETLIQDHLSKHITSRTSGTIVAEVPIQIDGKSDHLCVGAIQVRKGLIEKLRDPDAGRNHNLKPDDFKSYLHAFKKLYPLVTGELVASLFGMLVNKSGEVSMDFTGDVFYMHNDHYVIAFWYSSNKKVTFDRSNLQQIRLN